MSAFYFPPSFDVTLEKFTEIAKREGRSKSEILRKFIMEYVDRHGPGNPQRLMEPFFAPREPGTLVRLCDRCDIPATYIVHLWTSEEDHETQHVCDVHFQHVRKKSWYRFGWKAL